MNDFTKEELLTIFKSIRLTEMEHGECAVLDNLKFKVQSMIDNYCEHDGEIGKDYPAEKCMKCGAYWE